MPTYTYACTTCSHTFDAVQAFSDDALTTCPECQGALRKVYNSVGVVFKGSGFYRTDARAESKPSTSPSKPAEPAAAPAATPSTSATSTPAT